MSQNNNAVPSPASVPPAYSGAIKAKKETYALDRRDWITAGLLLVMSLFVVIAGVWGSFSAGFTVSFDLTFLVYTVYFSRKGTRIAPYPLLCGMLSAALSAVFITTTDPVIRFFSVCIMTVLAVIWFASLAQKPLFPGELGLAKRVLTQGVGSIIRCPKSLRSLFASDDPRVKTMAKILLGLLCATPVLFAVIALLIRSDAAFEGLMQHLFSDIAKTGAQVILSVCLFPFLLWSNIPMTKKQDI